VRRDEDFLAAVRTCTAGLFRSETRVGRGRQGLLLEDDAAVRVQLGRAFVSRACWIAKLIAGDGRMNVANERPSVESDEDTFMDQHGRSLHLVGADGCMNRIDLASIAEALALRWSQREAQRVDFPHDGVGQGARGRRFATARAGEIVGEFFDELEACAQHGVGRSRHAAA
jgi:hypothetical protein